MNKTTRIVLICICSLLIVATMVAMVFAGINYYGGKNKAHAEYADLAGTNTLVNFNQIFKFNPNGYISTTRVSVGDNNILKVNTQFNANSQIAVNPLTITNGHKYYIFVRGTALNGQRLAFANGGTIIFNYYSDMIYTATADNTCNYLWGYSGLSVGTYYINVIDLTQMFGSNEPNLQQAQEYFTAEYYNYTAGTLVPYSKDYLQGYQDGANDLLEAMTITYNAFTIGISSTTYANNIIERGEFGFSEIEGYYYFSGVIGINLQAIVERGTYFDVDYTFLIPDFSGETQSYKLSYELHFAYVDDNNNLIDIVAITPTNDGNYNSYNGSFVLPISTNKVYCYVNDGVVGQDNQATLQCYAFKSDLTFKSTDVALLMTNAYQRGSSDMQERYNMNGDLYNEIWQLGYNNGLAAQNATLGTMDYIGAAFSGIGSILQIELLPGIPFSLFILLPLMFGLITFIVKLTKGGD